MRLWQLITRIEQTSYFVLTFSARCTIVCHLKKNYSRGINSAKQICFFLERRDYIMLTNWFRFSSWVCDGFRSTIKYSFNYCRNGICTGFGVFVPAFFSLSGLPRCHLAVCPPFYHRNHFTTYYVLLKFTQICSQIGEWIQIHTSDNVRILEM